MRVLTLGLAALAVSAISLPLLDAGPRLVLWITSYALSVIPVVLSIHGFSYLVRVLPTPRLLALGAILAVLGGLAALFGSPDMFDDSSRSLPLTTLYVANVLRLGAAASLGLALARYVLSPGVALLIAAVAAVSDLFSVLAGPTRMLLRQGSPALDFLVLVFPSFGTPLGFGLGISDFVFLALFAYMSFFLDLRYRLTLACCGLATILAMTTALILEQPLPTLPFISITFVLVNAREIYTALRN